MQMQLKLITNYDSSELKGRRQSVANDLHSTQFQGQYQEQDRTKTMANIMYSTMRKRAPAFYNSLSAMIHRKCQTVETEDDTKLSWKTDENIHR